MDTHRHNYVDGTDEFDLHFNAIWSLYLTYGAAIPSAGQHSAFSHNGDAELTAACRQLPMLIWIGKIAKNLCPITSVIRLHFLYRRNMRDAKAYEPSCCVIRKTLWLVVNRKLSIFVNDPGIFSGKFIN